MSLRQKYQAILSRLAPAGALGLSLALGAAPASASEQPTGTEPALTGKEGVSERLAAIRDAVSAIDQASGVSGKVEDRVAWWGNGAFGWPNWNNWRNWRNWGNWFHNW